MNFTNFKAEYVYALFSSLFLKLLLHYKKIHYSSITSVGFPLIQLKGRGKLSFGSNIVLINTFKASTLGENTRCKILVYDNAFLSIGNKVGMSNVTIVATKSISIGSNVMIGAGTTIIDSDFHSLNSIDWFTDQDEKKMCSKSVVIGDNVFIGMNTIILKGTTIGSNSIIAAGSVVSCSIPSNEVWGGNPARFIKEN